MKLEPLGLANLETVRRWRHEVRETLRTSQLLTEEMQADYYNKVICNRDSKTRYFALYEYFPKDWGVKITNEKVFMGYGGIENITWENHNGEMSLLINPHYRGHGYGAQAVELFLDEAFGKMNLHTVYGECYFCAPWQFWEKMVRKYSGESVTLPARKYYNFEYYNSYYFTFYRSIYEQYMRNPGEGNLKAAAGEKHQVFPR